ncbi:MAG: hypothetical protein PVI86_18740 [Phycisphaerae bacterium]|jgi:hypothetical protein
MTESTKIEFRYRRISQIDDITDLVAILFPGNKNQQHAAARILMALKHVDDILPTLGFLHQQGISRRTLERTRAKLARLGLIEHVTWMNSRYGGRQGWKLSGRMSASLRALAGKLEAWQKDSRSERREKDERLLGVLD